MEKTFLVIFVNMLLKLLKAANLAEQLPSNLISAPIGLKTSKSSVDRFFFRHNMTFKKKPAYSSE